jgi:hypothetical protein
MSAKAALAARVARVASMSRDELRVRVSQEVCKRYDLLLSKTPFAAPKPKAPFGGGGRFFFESDDVPAILDQLRKVLPGSVDKIMVHAESILHHRFDLLGYEGVDYGLEINWHFDAVHGKKSPRVPWFQVPYLDFDRVGDHKVTWELNRHQHLVTLAKAYRLTGNRAYADELFAQWYHWQTHNPYPVGINWASSLEVAFRSLSWLWVWHLLQGCPAMPQSFPLDLHRALIQSARHIDRYLSTYFAPNTHLLGEAVALFFIGTLAPNSRAAQRWQKLGWRIVLQEAQRQVLPDGMHFEQSTYYHVYALDFFLHARILAARNNVPIPAFLDETILKMMEALCVLGSSGSLPQFGDDDGGRVFDPRRNRRSHMLDPLSPGAAFFKRPDFKAASCGPTEEMLWLAGAGAAKEFESLSEINASAVSSCLESSGIYVMSATDVVQQLVIDAGRQGPGWAGHGHADALSVQLSIDGKEILTDPGTFTYVDAIDGRAYFRSTACHNTVQVDGVSQAESAGPFKWTNPAHAKVERWISGKSFDLFSGSHSGYARLHHGVVHHRTVFYFKPRFWLIYDFLEGTGVHHVDVPWHFVPGSLASADDIAYFRGRNGAALTLATTLANGWKADSARGWYSPRYGAKETSPVFHVSGPAQLPFACATALVPGLHANIQLERISSHNEDTDDVRGYRLSLSNCHHDICFPTRPGAWAKDGVESDARFVYCSNRSTNRCGAFIVCGGTYLDLNHHRVFQSDAPVEKKEWALDESPEPVMHLSSAQESYSLRA